MLVSKVKKAAQFSVKHGSAATPRSSRQIREPPLFSRCHFSSAEQQRCTYNHKHENVLVAGGRATAVTSRLWLVASPPTNRRRRQPNRRTFLMCFPLHLRGHRVVQRCCDTCSGAASGWRVKLIPSVSLLSTSDHTLYLFTCLFIYECSLLATSPFEASPLTEQPTSSPAGLL